ncbi:MAG: Asp23/Gls24 family envelope stress response protein [Clostridia bacterium]|nr:Asp23/Gls24 family envelope stress response protein [Clostridia bacterium]
MSVNTSNVYGKISISDKVLEKVAAFAALDCYGIVDLVPRRFKDSVAYLLKKQSGAKGIKVVTNGDRIFIDVYVIVKYGVSINAVAEALKEGVKYKVERFSGMIVDSVNVNIMGVKL